MAYRSTTLPYNGMECRALRIVSPMVIVGIPKPLHFVGSDKVQARAFRKIGLLTGIERTWRSHSQNLVKKLRRMDEAIVFEKPVLLSRQTSEALVSVGLPRSVDRRSASQMWLVLVL